MSTCGLARTDMIVSLPCAAGFPSSSASTIFALGFSRDDIELPSAIHSHGPFVQATAMLSLENQQLISSHVSMDDILHGQEDLALLVLCIGDYILTTNFAGVHPSNSLCHINTLLDILTNVQTSIIRIFPCHHG